ncbi:MAG: glycosyltransferase family 2 protein [bacterium]|nr:glycosyltransferase family 2 protein [bacterium]
MKTRINISVIICTKNRCGKLKHCIGSLLRNSDFSFEIVIIDQSDTPFHITQNKKLASLHNIRYFTLRKKAGLSTARNLGIIKARARICAFTDDDCIVSKNWLTTGLESFNQSKQTSAIFGNVFSFSPKNHENQKCPGTIERKKQITFSMENLFQHGVVGHGNNMMIDKRVFETTGFFKNWLGQGTVLHSAEESELIFRILNSGKTCIFDPKLSVWHNRWMSRDSHLLHDAQYDAGNAAYLSYYALKGSRTAKKMFFYLVSQNVLRRISFQTIANRTHFKVLSVEIFNVLKGTIFGVVQATLNN